jgi:hypothetical protein
MGKFKEILPDASSLIQSLRNIGYSFETAVSDIIDNSITANAENIDIFFQNNSQNIKFAILDNGIGMNEKELINAMKPGSFNPLDFRSEKDLGRFGLGLKTASFSQCKKLTVISKQGNNIYAAEWDLDYVLETNRWEIKILDKTEIDNLFEIKKLKDYYSGTLVIWNKIDRITENSNYKYNHYFNELIKNLGKHIELVFHRFLDGRETKPPIKITLQSNKLKPFDPFMRKYMATQELPTEEIMMNGEKIIIRPFIIPHYSKLSKEDYEFYAGAGGYNKNQGFYVYRNKRLLISGTWFRIIPQKDFYKLARIQIDLPNSLDHLWNIDIKKSTSSPPPSVRERLKKIIEKISGSSKKVYTARGHKSFSLTQPIWFREAKNGDIFYRINKQHILLQKFIKTLNNNQINEFNIVLSLIEENIPKEIIYNDMTDTPKNIKNGEIDDSFLEEKVTELLKDRIITKNDFNMLSEIEPFNKYTKSWKRFFLKRL